MTAGPNHSAENRLREIEQQLEQNEAQLEERNRTVQELTARLSQTVEKLDRFKRGGSDQNVIRMAAFPKEVVEQQSELVGDLKRVVELWEKMQLACDLSRLESQVSHLHELFEEHFKEQQEEEAEPEAAEAGAAETGESEASNGVAEADDIADKAAEGGDAFALDDEIEIRPVPPPEIVDLPQAGESVLRRCVDQQEAYIDYLSARLQRATDQKSAVDWEELSGDAEKITHQLEDTVSKIQEGRHFAEFEMALQQTRLRRKECELQDLTAELEQQMKSLNPNSGNTEEDGGGGQRWLRMLGVGKKNS